MLDYRLLNTKLEAMVEAVKRTAADKAAWRAEREANRKARADEEGPELIPPIEGFDALWSQQVPQFPPKGPAGVGYFKGDMGHDGWYVDCLLFRDKKGKLKGVLYHYPMDMPPHEQAGNINVMVDPAHQGEGIGKTLLKAALKRWDINMNQQKWTPGGDALRKSVAGKAKAPAKKDSDAISVSVDGGPRIKLSGKKKVVALKKDHLYLVWEVEAGKDDSAFGVNAADPEEAEKLYRQWTGRRGKLAVRLKDNA